MAFSAVSTVNHHSLQVFTLVSFHGNQMRRLKVKAFKRTQFIRQEIWVNTGRISLHSFYSLLIKNLPTFFR